MDDQPKIPKMLMFLFGEEAAEKTLRGASSRLRRWCGAFDEWLANRKQNYKPGAHKQAVQAWQRLLHQQSKIPWELRRQDFEQHAAWMEAKGYAPTTIANALGSMASFYRWCDEREVDRECPAGFNPAEGARRPKIRRHAGAKLLSLGEIEALLGIMRRDDSPLGKREYAFFVTRLRLGAPLRNLQQLRWGQIERDASIDDEGGAWVRWRAEAGRIQLPEEAWEAMRDWLRASGRLERMEAGDYIFTPLIDPLREQVGDQPGAWAEGRCLSSSQILSNLKLYGRRAGIAEEKLTLMALRRTAIRLRLEAGGNRGDSTTRGDSNNLEEIQAFLDSREESKFTKSRLKRLPQLPEEGGGSSEDGGDEPAEPPVLAEQEGPEATPMLAEPAVPLRKSRPFQPGEGMTHGLYAHSQPAQEVLAMIAENIQGIEEEITGLRTLGRGLLEIQIQARSSQTAVQLADAYTHTAERLAKMIEGEKQLGQGREEETWAEDFLAMLDREAEAAGEGPVSGEMREAALGGDPKLTANARRLVEEIAATRLVLRNTLRLARQAGQNGETGEYVHLTEIYSTGCYRLMQLLRAGKADQGRLASYLREQIDSAIDEESKSWPTC